ncbi:transcription initiation factor TFIID component TAF4 family protein [Trichuris suis]|nr:transcription initiation factor TFIID component TAF4 family protein [Trichuris suis]
MADVGGLEKLLNSEVDEAALKRISGTLQSELISPEKKPPSSDGSLASYLYHNGPTGPNDRWKTLDLSSDHSGAKSTDSQIPSSTQATSFRSDGAPVSNSSVFRLVTTPLPEPNSAGPSDGAHTGGANTVNLLRPPGAVAPGSFVSPRLNGTNLTHSASIAHHNNLNPSTAIAVCGVDIRQRGAVLQNPMQPSQGAQLALSQAGIGSRNGMATIIRTPNGQLLLLTGGATPSVPLPVQVQQHPGDSTLSSIMVSSPGPKQMNQLPNFGQLSSNVAGIRQQESSAPISGGSGGQTNSFSLSLPSSASTNEASPAECSNEAAAKKCISFLRTLIKLAKDKGNPSVLNEVNRLVRSLLMDQVNPTAFTNRIPSVLNSKPQASLLPFLEKTLPAVQRDYIAGKFVIEGLEDTDTTPSVSSASIGARSTQVAGGYQHTVASRPYTPSASPLLSPTTVISGLTAVGSSAANISGPYIVATPVGIRPGLLGNVPHQQASNGMQMHQQYPSVAQQLSNAQHVQSASSEQYRPTSRNASFSSDVGSSCVVVSSASVEPKRPQYFQTQSSKANSLTPSKSPGLLASRAPATPAVASVTPDKYKEPEDDINDVATMGGVNLAEESQKILASTAEVLSAETRSCGPEQLFLHSRALNEKLRMICSACNIDDFYPDLCMLISMAVEQRLREILERLCVFAEHRTDNLRVSLAKEPFKKSHSLIGNFQGNIFYEPISDVRGQLRFMDELSRQEQKRREEREREMLLRMAKSRSSKIGDTEQQRIKERAKELQKAEQEELKNRSANAAANLAMASSTRKRHLVTGNENPSASSSSLASAGGMLSQSFSSFGSQANMAESVIRTQASTRPRIKRVSIKDLQHVFSSDRHARLSKTYPQLLFK